MPVPASLTVSPAFATIGVAEIPVVVTAVGGTFSSPTFTVSGGATLSSATTASTTVWTATLNTSACSAGTITLTDTTDSVSCTITLTPANYYPTLADSMQFGTIGNDLSTFALSNGGGWANQNFDYGTGQFIGKLTTHFESGTSENMAYNPIASSQAIYIAVDGPMMGFDSTGSVDIMTLTPTDGSLVGALINFDPIAETGRIIRYRYGGGTPLLQIIDLVANAATTVASTGTVGTSTGTVPTLTSGAKYTLKWAITNNSQTVGIYDSLGVQKATVSNTYVLGTQAGTFWLPGCPGFYLNSNTGSAGTGTTGWRIGNLQITSGPRAATVHQYSGSGTWANIPAVTRTANFLFMTCQQYNGTTFGNNSTGSDYWCWRVPINSPAAIPSSPTVLNNCGTGDPGLINQWSGSAQCCQNFVAWWLPYYAGSGFGGTGFGRIVAIWTLYPNGYFEASSYPGINNATSASIWASHSDDEGATWATPTDVTAQFKTGVMANATAVEAGPCNCSFVLPNGDLYTPVWYNLGVAVSGTVSVTTASPTALTTSVSGSVAVGYYIAIAGDSSKGVYQIASGSGTSWTLASNYGGASNATAASATITGPYGGTTTANQGSIAVYASTTDGTSGWTLGGAIGSVASGTGVNPNEAQAILRADGSILAVQRFYNTTDAPPAFVKSTNNGTSFSASNPSSFPYSVQNVTCGLLNYAGAVVFCGPNMTLAGPTTRAYLTATASSDGGTHWSSITAPSGNVPTGTQIVSGNTQYCSMTILPGGNIALFGMASVANGENLFLWVIPPTWLGLTVPMSGAMM